MKSHKSLYGHRLRGDVVKGSGFESSCGGDFAIPYMLVQVKCSVCGRVEVRKEMI